MSIRRKILLIWVATFSFALALTLALFWVVLTYPLQVMDRESAQEDYRRACNAILRRLEQLETSVGHWAPWDDTYRFVGDLNPEYVEANLSAGTLANLDVNMMLFLDRQARLVHGVAVDLETGTLADPPEGIDAKLGPDSPLLAFTPEDGSNSGVLLLPEGPLLVAAQPILTSQWGGPSRGTLVFGRFLDKAEVESLSAEVRLPIEVFPAGAPHLPEDVLGVLPELEGADTASVTNLETDSLASYGVLEGLDGSPALVIRVESPRLAFEAGKSGLQIAVGVFLGLGLVIGAMALLITERLVTSRISRLTSSVLEIARSGDASARVAAEGSDELPVLAQAINRMLEALGQSQSALRSSEERFRGFFASAGDCIYIKDLSLRYTLVNPAMASFLGRTPVDVVFRLDEELIPDRAEVERLREIDLRCIAGEVIEEERAVRVGGRERVFHRVSAPMRDEKGAVIGVYGVARDITSRVVAERAVLASEQRYLMLLETLQEGILVTDEYAVVTYANPCMARMLGYTTVEMLRRPLSTFFDGEEASLLTPDLLAQGDGGREKREVELKHKDGGMVAALLQAGPIHDGQGRLIGAIAAVEDLSDVRAAEEELMRLRGLLASSEGFAPTADPSPQESVWAGPPPG
jgi:PAS domain S-box-containing protein